jgi:phosphatidylethanolamine-binding protein (PEBP) family uncharacterized protein
MSVDSRSGFSYANVARAAAAVVAATTALAGCSSASAPKPASSPAGHASPRASQATITLTSSAFQADGSIPAAYTCDATGSALSPPLRWSGVPAGTGWLALYVYDNTGNVIHWIVVNMEPSVSSMPAGSASGGTEVTGYLPMCPGTGNTDQYQFTLYAEPAAYHLTKIGASYAVDPSALAAHALGIGILVGNYSE